MSQTSETVMSLSVQISPETHGPEQVLVCDHQADQVSPTHCLLHLLLLLGNGPLVAMVTTGEQVGRHHHGDIPQRHPVVVLMRDNFPEEDQQGLLPWKQIQD